MPAAIDDFSTFRTALESPYDHAAAITTSDTTDLSDVTRAIYVGGGAPGNITCTINGVDVVFKLVPVGTVLQVRTSRVKATGTTATDLVALW